MNDTDYLNSISTNRERLHNSINQLNRKVVDINQVINLMQDMSIMELDEIKNECDYLIDNKMNEYTS